MNVTTASGKSYYLVNNREIAKFHLFIAPKLIAAGDTIEGDIPRLVMTDEVNQLAKINQRIRQNRARRADTTHPFDDGVPF